MGLKLHHTVGDGCGVPSDKVVVEATLEKLNTVLNERGILHHVTQRVVQLWVQIRF